MGKPTSKVSKVVVAGPLGPFAAAFEARLDGLGYTTLTTCAMRSMARLSRWLDAGGMTVADLTGERVEQYVHEGRSGSSSPRSLAALLGLLDSLGVLPASPPAPPCSATEALLASFHRHLLVERALAPSTAAAYADRARRFLRVDLEQLRTLAQPWPAPPRPPQDVPQPCCPAQPEPMGTGR